MAAIIVEPQLVNQILIEEKGATVAVQSLTGAIATIVTQGPQGPPGGTVIVYQQAAPATVWTINHNLGYKPSVELLDAGSQEIDGDIAHPSINQTIVTLNPASAGLARLI